MELERHVYDKDTDPFLQNQKDEFEPLSRPLTKFMRLPEDVQVEWVAIDKEVHKLKILMDEEYVGISSLRKLWVPNDLAKPCLL